MNFSKSIEKCECKRNLIYSTLHGIILFTVSSNSNGSIRPSPSSTFNVPTKPCMFCSRAISERGKGVNIPKGPVIELLQNTYR